MEFSGTTVALITGVTLVVLGYLMQMVKGTKAQLYVAKADLELVSHKEKLKVLMKDVLAAEKDYVEKLNKYNDARSKSDDGSSSS